MDLLPFGFFSNSEWQLQSQFRATTSSNPNLSKNICQKIKQQQELNQEDDLDGNIFKKNSIQKKASMKKFDKMKAETILISEIHFGEEKLTILFYWTLFGASTHHLWNKMVFFCALINHEKYLKQMINSFTKSIDSSNQLSYSEKEIEILQMKKKLDLLVD